MANQSKERNLLAGFDFSSEMTGLVAFFMMILSLFTVTVEVFIRRDMGQRYFNAINFYAGFMALGFVSFFVNAAVAMASSFGPSAEGGFSWLMLLVLLAYIGLGIRHFLLQWWREEAGKPVHSLDPGFPRLEPVGRLIMKLVNAALAIPVRLFSATLSAEDRADLPRVLPVFKDSVTFTYRFGEPFLLFVLGLIVSAALSGLVGTWLMVSSFALLLYMNVGLEQERQQVFDVRDQMLEAAEMNAALNGESDFMRVSHSTKVAMQSVADRAEKSPKMMDNVKMFNPSIAEAMESLNPKLRDMGKSDDEG